MTRNDGWDFGPEDAPTDEEVEQALSRVTKKGKRRQSVRTAGSGAGVIAVMLLLVAGAIFGADKVQNPSTEFTGSERDIPSTTTSTGAPTPATDPPADPTAGRPKTLVTYGRNEGEVGGTGEINLRSSVSGEVIRALATASPNVLQISNDSKVVFYDNLNDINGPDACTAVYSVPIAGGDPVRLAKAASHPGLSPDGKRLAYLQEDCATTRGGAIVVMDLATKKSRVIATTNNTEGYSFTGLMWVDNNFVSGNVLSTDGAATEYSYSYDVNVPGPVNFLGDASSRTFVPPGFADAPGDRQPTWLPFQSLNNGQVLAVLSCCQLNLNTNADRLAITKGDAVVRTITTTDDGFSWILSAASDLNGNHVAFTAWKNEGDTPDLWVQDVGLENPTLLARNVTYAVWR